MRRIQARTSFRLNAPKPLGPYSQAIQVGKTVYLSGQLRTDPKTNLAIANASTEDQTRLVLENLKAALAALPRRHE